MEYIGTVELHRLKAQFLGYAMNVSIEMSVRREHGKQALAYAAEIDRRNALQG